MTAPRLTLRRPQAAAQTDARTQPATPTPATQAQASPRQPAELVTPAEAARMLQVGVTALERWRTTGDGPAFVRLSSKTIRYRRGDIESFVADRVRTSTAAA